MSRFIKKFCSFGLVLSAAGLATATAQAQPAQPAFVPVDNFYFNADKNEPHGDDGPHRPTDATLTDAEAADVLARIKALKFPRYVYSSCDERAHAAYMLLPPTLRPKVMKIFVITPSMYTLGIKGSIRSTRNEPAYKTINWGYHVALALRTKDGLKIIDSGLRPDELLSEKDWFGEMNVSPLTFWTLTDAAVYRFKIAPGAHPAVSKSRNGQAWTGATYRYDQGPSANEWIPIALARDAIGADAIAGKTCQALTAIHTKPWDLQQALIKGAAEGPATDPCAGAFKRFGDERKRWKDLLSAS